MALAAAVTVGAWAARPFPLLLAAALVAGALSVRQPAVVCIAALVLASGLGARSEAGMSPVVRTQLVAAEVTLLADPVPRGPGVTAIGRLGRRHVQLAAYGRAARSLRARLAGERVVVNGELEPLRGVTRPRLAARHVSARVTVASVGDWYPGNALSGGANRVRRALIDGARSMPAQDRALFTGFVIGDDRDEPADLVDDFRRSGLSHLTAVSGENVAFVLVAAAPILRRLGLRARWLATIGLVVWFAMLTRFEPSVLRAAAMAALAATASFLARPASGRRLLALAITVCTLLDPFLVRSVGWWLSVGATVGLVLFAAPLAQRLPGPRWLAEPMATTLAAQLGVAPVTMAVFGAMPLAALPANLLAVPAAGPVMVWGLPVGIVAGLVPAPVARIAHLPTLVLVRWIEVIARVGARLPIGQLRAGHVPFLALGGVIAIYYKRRRRRVTSTGSVAAMEDEHR